MNKIVYTIITLALIVGIGIVFWGQSKNNTNMVDTSSAQNVVVRDGVQYITVHAQGGYSPKISRAQAHIPTKLIMKTNGTYDCSAALVIRSIGYQKVLPPIGEEVIDLGSPEAGELRGLCSMGMYNFTIRFN